MSEALPPIPTPPALFWRQVRHQYLPLLVFVVGLVAAIVIWSRWVAPPTLVAEVESVHADVRSIKAGTLAGMKVAPLQLVHAGQALGEVIITDPRVLEASLAVVRAELDSIRFTMDPVIGQQRIALDYERLLLDLLHARVQLASLQAQLFQAQTAFTRLGPLYANKLVTDERYEEAKNTRDGLEAQVKAQSELVARIEPTLKSFTAEGANGELSSAAQGLRAALKVEEEKLRLTEAELQPIPILAPIDGVVTAIHRQTGEVVAAGESIVQLTAARPTQIVGFLREPMLHEPKAGAAVEVRTRAFPRQVGTATVAQVGHQLEPVSPSLLAAMRLPVTNIPTEFGVRVLVTLPSGMSLRPGEHVDLILHD